MRFHWLGTGVLLVVVAVLTESLNPFYVGILTLIGFYALVTLGLNLFMGYAGQVSLGQAAFYGVGAYSVGILAVTFHWNSWLALAAGCVCAGILAYLVGFPTLRLKVHYLALATLGLGIIMDVVFQQLKITGGASGLYGIPPLGLFGHSFGSRPYSLLAWMLVALVLTFGRQLIGSRAGRALVAIKSSEIGSEVLGVDTAGYKRQVFVISAVCAGLAGGIYASWIGYIDPTGFGFLLSVDFVLMSVVGGLQSLWGAVFGAALVEILDQALKVVVPFLIPSAGGDYQMVFYGVILVAIMIFWPAGLTAGVMKLLQRGRGGPAFPDQVKRTRGVVEQ